MGCAQGANMDELKRNKIMDFIAAGSKFSPSTPWLIKSAV